MGSADETNDMDANATFSSDSEVGGEQSENTSGNVSDAMQTTDNTVEQPQTLDASHSTQTHGESVSNEPVIHDVDVHEDESEETVGVLEDQSVRREYEAEAMDIDVHNTTDVSESVQNVDTINAVDTGTHTSSVDTAVQELSTDSLTQADDSTPDATSIVAQVSDTVVVDHTSTSTAGQVLTDALDTDGNVEKEEEAVPMDSKENAEQDTRHMLDNLVGETEQVSPQPLHVPPTQSTSDATPGNATDVPDAHTEEVVAADQAGIDRPTHTHRETQPQTQDDSTDTPQPKTERVSEKEPAAHDSAQPSVDSAVTEKAVTPRDVHAGAHTQSQQDTHMQTHTPAPTQPTEQKQNPGKSVQLNEESGVGLASGSVRVVPADTADPMDEVVSDNAPSAQKAPMEETMPIPKKSTVALVVTNEETQAENAIDSVKTSENIHWDALVNDTRYINRPSYQLFSKALNPDLYDAAKVDRSERLERAQTRTMESEWDTDAWTSMIAEAQNGNVDTIRYYFGIFLSKFPMAARYWTLYIEKEIELSQFSRVEKCFQVLLPDIPNIDLFKLYLKYMKDSKSASATFKETMKTAYRFSLDQIGLDIASTSVWQEYIDFLKGWETATQYDASTKMVTLRETYQQAVVNPIQNVEGFWKEYDQYENGLNKLTARKLLQDKSAAYMTARAVLRDRRSRVDSINTQHLAVPLKGTSGENQQLALWKQYIAWEKTNPLKYDDRDVGVYKRVVLAYKQCLMTWYHCPEVWYEYCQFVAEGPPHDPGVTPPSATTEFSKACSALPTSQLLAFAFADYEEGKKNMAGATAAYERILADKELTDPTLVYIQYMKYKRRSETTAAGRKVFKRARDDKRTTGHQSYVAAALMEYFGTKKKDIADNIFRLGLKKHSTKVDYALSYLDYMLHLNESNNTRVLFERLLMVVPQEDQAPIWQRFLQFESDYGDLAAALSVEKRRREAMGMDAICHSIDRYHYLDLYPVDDNELERMGYQKIAPESSVEGVQSVTATDDTVSAINSDFVVPDLKCLDHFNPEQGVVGPLTGPKSITALLANLPPPMNFIGPYVDVEALFAGLSPPDEVDVPQSATDKLVEATQTPASNEDAVKSGTGKRKKKGQGDSDDETTSTVRATKGTIRRPVNIFNKRMRSTLAKDNQ